MSIINTIDNLSCSFDDSVFPLKYKKKIPFHVELNLNMEYRDAIRDIRRMDQDLENVILNYQDYLDLVIETNSTNIYRSLSYEAATLSKGEVNRISQSFINGYRDINDVSGSDKEVLNHWYIYLLNNLYKFPWTLEEVVKINTDLSRGVDGYDIRSSLSKERKMVTGLDGVEYFKTCSPHRVEECLGALIEWIKTSPYDELLTSVIFYNEVMMMAPFEEKNGPTGRLLFQLLLQKLGLKHSKLCKLDRVMIGFSEKFNNLIFYTETSSDYTPLIMYVVRALKDAYTMALEEVLDKDVSNSLDYTSKMMVKEAKRQEWFSVSESSSWVPGLTEQIARVKLNDLVDKGVIEKEGRTRATRFRFKDPFRTIKQNILNPSPKDDFDVEIQSDLNRC